MLAKVDYSERVRRIVALLDRGDLQDALAETHFEPNDVERGEAIVLRSFQAILHVLKGDPLLGLRIASDTRVDAVAPKLVMFRAEADHALMFALQALDEHARTIELAVECEQLGRDNDAPELVTRTRRIALGARSARRSHRQVAGLYRVV